MLKLPAPASSGDFFHMLTQADSSVKDAGIGIKRKTPLSSLAPVGKEKATVSWFAVPAHTQAEQKGNSFEDHVYSGEGHAHHITDIRFRPNSTVFATSSFDRTVKIWDAAKPTKAGVCSVLVIAMMTLYCGMFVGEIANSFLSEESAYDCAAVAIVPVLHFQAVPFSSVGDWFLWCVTVSSFSDEAWKYE
ncbi:hypothetical protein HAX54_047424 [Datura stramonium]|uniref:Uncharacterized protein n=1 Tax=Datura stramonium TaxID=4076 RepID=A0ABS8SSE6_DATST|nr:hypothetical protein [Datura stramonium]